MSKMKALVSLPGAVSQDKGENLKYLELVRGILPRLQSLCEHRTRIAEAVWLLDVESELADLAGIVHACESNHVKYEVRFLREE